MADTAAPETTARATKQTLSGRWANYETDRLPGRAVALARELNTQITAYLLEQGVTTKNFPARLNEALHRTLPIEGRTPRLTGVEYGVLAVNQWLRPIYDGLALWDEEPACQVLEALRVRWAEMAEPESRRFTLDLELVPSWLKAHKDHKDAGKAVAQCVALDAPEEVRIEKRLAQAGAQKRVFQASWTVADDPTEIVIK